MIASFPPLIDENAEMLILGTMPGVKSLEKQHYYAHPQNQFWKIIFTLFGSLPVAEKYEDRKKFLLKNNLALWDVLAYCERKGSLDIHIRNQVENDIPQLLANHPKIRKIAFNGKESYRYFSAKFGTIDGISYYVMPSTSPAHTIRFETKLKAWQQLLD